MSKKWGTPLWYFFHSFSHHIHNDFFINNKITIFNLINRICNNLPCPECKKHAVHYLNTNFKSSHINNKNDLILFFFNFHNNVNIRLNKNIFNNLDIYQKSNLINITKLFCTTFKNSSKNLLFSFHCDILLKDINSFINNNIKHFYPK